MTGWYPDGWFSEWYSEWYPIYGIESPALILDISIERLFCDILGIENYSLSGISIKNNNKMLLDINQHFINGIDIEPYFTDDKEVDK